MRAPSPSICHSQLMRFLFLTSSIFLVLAGNTFAQTPTANPTQEKSPTDQTSQARQLEQLEPLKTLPGKGKRWALVVGIDKYADPQISTLRGAANDARTLGDALIRYAGFPQDQVIVLASDQPAERQPTRVNLLRRLSNLAAAVPKDGLLVISFSGHGMERGGQAFLLPSDAQISDQISFLEDTAISVTRMRDLIKSTGVNQVMVLLDACRNDPGGRADAPNPLTEAYVKGFNFDVRNREVQAFATIYATAVGQRAYEYTEKKQGYFTWAVVEALKGAAANSQGEVTLSELVKFVQDAVPKRIAIDLGGGKQQRPFATIEGYKAEELVIAATAGAKPPTEIASSSASVDPVAIELSFWDSIKNSTNPDDFKAYLDKYPDGQFAALARNRAQVQKPTTGSSDTASLELTYWNAIKDSKNPSDFRAYITKFPNGVFVDLANGRISSLETEARNAANARELAAEEDRRKNTHSYNVRIDQGRTEGTLTVAPGVLMFEPKKQNAKKNETIQCSEVQHIEPGLSAFQPPHVNLTVGADKGKQRTISYYTSSGGTGLFAKTPVVDVTQDVINAIIEACKMRRINK